LPTPAHIVEEAQKALANGRTMYPDQRGEPRLREAIASKLLRDNGLRYDPATEILVTTGGTFGIYAALAAMCNEGDTVLVPDPVYDAYLSPIRLTGAVPVAVPSAIVNGRFVLTVEALEAAWTPQCRALLLNTPWNPTGTVLTQKELSDIATFCERHGVTIISDEIYEAIVYEGHEHISPATVLRERSVVVNALSKTYCMTGWRVGYVAAPAEFTRAMLLVLQQSSRGPATFVQDAAAVALTVRRAWGRLREDEAAFFQWCWLLTSLVFLTICQSKIPSYAFYLFVPLGMLIGRTLDDLLTRGFATVGERRLVVGCAVFQCALVGVFVALPLVPWLASQSASLTKTLRPFEVPVMMVFGCLAVSVVFLLRKKHAVWLLASSTASLALLVGALTVALPAVEAESSARPVAQALLEKRRGNEPLLTGKFLARGIIYYTNTDITAPNSGLHVLAKKEQPFWAAHHPLPVVVKEKGLREFLKKHPSALCALRKSDWLRFSKEDAFAAQEEFLALGENVVVRAVRPVRPPEPAK
jgi:aspartate/methionine/tyrosine aminotransferase